MLLCAVTTWAADVTLSNGSNSSLNWSSDDSSTCAPWENSPADDAPAGLTAILGNNNVTGTKQTVTINEAGAITVTFQYTGGSQRLDMYGVDLVDANGDVVASDYHHGFTGGAKSANVYTLVTNFTGDYTLRYWVLQGDYLYKTNGTITVSYENTAVYERRIAVARITPLIENVRSSLGAINVEASQLSTNGALSGSAGSLGNLLDGNNGSEFVTTWQATAGESHYIQIDLGTEDLGLEMFSLMWVNRSNGRDGLYAGNIKGSTDGSTWDVLKEIADGEVSKAASAKIQIDNLPLKNSNSEQYRYIRLTCTLGQFKLPADNEYCFGLAEFTVKGTLSSEEQAIADLCDAAQAVVDDANSTAADINGQYRTLKLATVEKPTYPFTITTDDENPALYVIKSGRGDYYFTLADDGYISLNSFNGSNEQAWYFKEVVNDNFDYVLNIIPYAANTTSMGYSSTDSQAASVSNAASNASNEWVLDASYATAEDAKLGFKPYDNQGTYLSNFGGVGNKMGFWTGNPSADAGTAVYITSAAEAAKTLLANKINFAKTLTSGTSVGYYTATAIAALQSDIATAEGVYNSTEATFAQVGEALTELQADIDAKEIVLPTEGAFYTIASACSDDRNNKKMYANADGYMHFQDAATLNEVFQFVPAGENKFYLYSIQRGTYLNTTKAHGYGQHTMLATTTDDAVKVTISNLGKNNIVKIVPEGGAMMHAQASGASVVAWDNEAYDNGSAWTIDKVADITALAHSVKVGDAGYSTLYLNYAVSIPEGVEVYGVNSINNGWVTMEAINNVIPAKTAVILKNAGDFTFNYTNETSDATSLLKGTSLKANVTPDANTTYYVLAKGENGVGLYPDALSEGIFRNNANKAYLPVVVESGNAAPSYSFNFDWNGTTGIEGVVAEGAQDGAIYDITGRRVKAITAPGIYIVNGKKVVK